MSQILIVEDEPRIAAFIAKGLKAAGYTPVVEASGLLAVARAVAGEPDLIVLDVGLPDIDGFEVLERIRGQGVNVPVIMLVNRFRAADGDLQALHEGLFLQVAWLSTPGAQDIAREDPIRQLLAAFDDEVGAWPELVALAAEVGEQPLPPAPADPYGEPDPAEPPAVDPVREAVLAAVLLTRAGVEVEELLASGTLLANLEGHSDQHQAALRAIARVLPPPSEGVIH